MKKEVGHPEDHIFSAPLLLTEEEIIQGAHFIGDDNPPHSDHDHPHTKVLGGIIASGSHVCGIFSAMMPKEFYLFGRVLGMGMTYKFLLPIYPMVQYTMQWQVTQKNWKEKAGGYIYTLDGKISKNNSPNDIAVTSQANIIFYPDKS